MSRPIAFLLLCWVCLSAQVALAANGYMGVAQCASCHEAETQAWRGSMHEHAMAEASETSVLGDFANATVTAHGVTSRFFRRDGAFFVHTDGPDGRMQDFRIKYTFGWSPLQQYLIEFPNGHIQALGLAWDSRPAKAGGQRWFHLYPDERMDSRHPQHWTARSQTWNHQCAECHSTNLQKNYDLERDRYDTTWSEINVACEACHGPGARHVEWARGADRAGAPQPGDDKGLVVPLARTQQAQWTFDHAAGKPLRTGSPTASAEVEACAHCHARREAIHAGEHGGRPLGNTHRIALLEAQLYFPDGQIKDEVFEYGSFVQSKMHTAGVVCSNCHDPHNLKLRAEGNALCTGCHLASRYDAGTHHHHDAGSAGAQCKNCHMPERVYMVNDWRADHSLRVPRPDLSVRLGTPNACTGCHADEGAPWAAMMVETWFPDSRSRGPHFAEAFHAAESGKPDATARLIEVANNPSLPAIVRASAASRIASGASAPPLPTVQKLLADPEPLVRSVALRFLDVRDARIRLDLGWPHLRDRSRIVRLEAARVLAPLARQPMPAAARDELVGAVAEYEASLMVNADLPEAHVQRGLLAMSVGAADEAEQAFRTALRLEPGASAAYINLADLYRLQQRDGEGEQLLREGIERVAHDADLRHTLGLLLVRQGRLADALVWFRQAAEAEPHSAHYSYVHALAVSGAGDPGAALRLLREANARHPDDREILFALATMSRDQNALTDAIAYAEALLQRFPQDRQARALRDALGPAPAR